MELMILDRDPENWRPLGLELLLSVLRGLHPDWFAGDWEVTSEESDPFGSGLWVTALEARAVAAGGACQVAAAEVCAKLDGTYEWFDDVRFTVSGRGVEFGIFDSSYLFVRAPDRELLEPIAARFRDVRWESDR